MTEKEIALRARSLITEQQPSTKAALPTLTALVSVALANIIERALQSGRFGSDIRFQVQTDELTIGAGNSVDISTATNTKRIRLDLLRQSDLTLDADPNANAAWVPRIKWMKSRARLQLGASIDMFFTCAYLDTSILYFVSQGDPSIDLTGVKFRIRASAVPLSVADLPDDSLAPELAMEVANLATTRNREGEANSRGLTSGQQKT
jgi:hypothetical protein